MAVPTAGGGGDKIVKAKHTGGVRGSRPAVEVVAQAADTKFEHRSNAKAAVSFLKTTCF